jgi:hypothetical protein
MAFNDLFAGKSQSQYHLDSKNAQILGVTKDETGATAGGYTVQCFVTATGVRFSLSTSDGSGNYAVSAPVGVACFCVSYKVGSPDKAGTTVNTLVGVGGY